MLCRYKKPADWELLSDLAEQHPVPLIGNGDVLTHYEVRSMSLVSSMISHTLGHEKLIFQAGHILCLPVVT